MFAKAKYCSLRCSSTGRWIGPEGDAYRIRLGAARRRFNELHPEANAARIAKMARTRGLTFPALDPGKAGRSKAIAVVPLTRCEDCGVGYSGPRSLHRHHVNSDATDNRPENLLVLCPRCHRRRHEDIGTGFGAKRVPDRRCERCGQEFHKTHGERYCSPECYRKARFGEQSA